ncbi:hypothetical protein G7062_02340 [Erysipelothrix sp. HDW6C]|uniref:DUF6903 family protein n=1 Tax=Erysipelothrix sp. HDW6C TaxID=2714930 RepID=UPI001407C475|nr:hypothetical protein [Erysipelothrix sp. HDW6C]QIK69196.1 hypothetical protein G7062_02340 [Erysipelothrix sp. HDW6C]
MKKPLLIILKLIAFVVGVALITINQRTIGMMNLLWMVVGLGILLFLMYDYNRKFR